MAFTYDRVREFCFLRIFSSGFAVRCEAMALPRRTMLFDAGYAIGSGCALPAQDQGKFEWNQRGRSKTEPRAQRGVRAAYYREAKPSPHVRRQSR